MPHNLNLEIFEKILIKTNGATIFNYVAKEITDLQNAVGGIVSKHNIKDSDAYIYVNKDGWLKDLPINNLATKLFNQYVYGDIILCVKNRDIPLMDQLMENMLT